MRRKLLSLILSVSIVFSPFIPSAQGHWPVAHSSHVTSIYRFNHKAVDIAAPCGSLVYPSLDGTVSFAGWRNNGGGWQVIVNHGSGKYTGYYHMRSRPRVVRGQHVHYNRGYRSGGLLGYVGSTGWSTGCHLHVEYWNGYPWASGSWRMPVWPIISNGYWFDRRYY